MAVRCPGQNLQYWKPEDIFLLHCPFCDGEIEFWKDEPFRYCRGCGREVRNPRIDLGCAKWCKFAADCLGAKPDDSEFVVPIPERLSKAYQARWASTPDRAVRGLERMARAAAIRENRSGADLVIKAAALLADLPDTGPVWRDDATAVLREAGLDDEMIQRIISAIIEAIGPNRNPSPEAIIVREAGRDAAA